MELKTIQFLLDYCSHNPETYNEVANDLRQHFNIVSAEQMLLVTYYVCEERRKSKHEVHIK